LLLPLHERSNAGGLAQELVTDLTHTGCDIRVLLSNIQDEGVHRGRHDEK
jgi:hypothetical protein